MADRKISDLSFASRVEDSDLLVVVTGIQGVGAGQSTHKFPMSGLVNNIVNIEELVTAKTGIFIVSTLNDNAPNQIEINVTGYASSLHNHSAADITDFGSAVSGNVQQIIKVLESPEVHTNGSETSVTSLSIEIPQQSKYLCEFCGIFTNNEVNTDISGSINVNGDISELNHTTKIYGTWNYIRDSGIYNSTVPMTGLGPLVINSDGNESLVTVVNKFVVETTSTSTDNITVSFLTNSTNANTSGVIQPGSWLKAEKVI